MIIQDKYTYIGKAIQDYNKLLEEYQYYQKWQTSLRKDYYNWPGPPESFDKDAWKNSINEQMWFNKQELKYKTSQIKKLKKIIKELNKEQNKLYNSQDKRISK